MKAIYFGAGLDTYPYTNVSDITDWVSVDEKSDENFIRKLTDELLSINFRLYDAVDNKLYFKNSLTEKTIIYYVNCKIPQSLNIMNISNCFTIYCSKYIPHINILDFIGSENLTFIGRYNNDYYPEGVYDNTLVYGINNLKDIRDKFNKFIYIDMDNVYVYDNWFKFLKKSKNHA